MENKTEQTNMESWIDEECKNLETHKKTERYESLRFEENKVVDVEIDFTNKFESWTDVKNNLIKKIIPLMHNGVKKVWWLNRANPTYSEILALGKQGITKFKIMKTGQAKDTKYILIR